MSVQYEVRSGVALITLNNPPVNSFDHDARREIAVGLARADADAHVKAIVITGAGKVFSGGADIREFGSPQALAEPSLWGLISQIEASRKPVVAAIHSVCLGGGLELSLACHYRVATSGAQVGLPEVKIGLLPGAGGTQRLPRVIGVDNALNMIVRGEPVNSELLAEIPGQTLFNKIIDGDLTTGAIQFAQKVANVRPLPLVRNLSVGCPNADAYFQSARNKVGASSKNFPAPLKCVDAVAAAVTMNFDAGLKFERELFTTLMLTPESKALRHAFFAERATNKIPDLPADTPLRKINKVAVVGAGTMGSGIAMNFLNAGLPVVMLEVTQKTLDKGLDAIHATYKAQLFKGKLVQDTLEQRMALLTGTLEVADLRDADLVIEAVFEDMEVKQQVFKALDATMKPGAILASNTSTLDLNKIADSTKRPQDVIGLHFFSPAHVMKLLEIVRGEKTAKDVLASVMALGKKIKKTCVLAGVCDGFIGNRMIEQYFRQAGFMLDEGCTPSQIDQAMEQFGFAMGPFRMADLAGNDVGWAIRKRRARERPNLRYSKTADLLCEMGRFGQKTGAGWYDYAAGRRDAIASPEVNQLIERHRATLGVTPREISDDEIVHRLVYALVNEGARIVEQGIALRASDIDVVYLTGYGFPLHRGGPMFYADSVGLPEVVAAMQRFAHNPLDDAEFWRPAPLLSKLAAQGRTFSKETT